VIDSKKKILTVSATIYPISTLLLLFIAQQ